MGRIPAKPSELIDILVKCFSPENGLVLDLFCGSGQIPLSCIKQNRNYLAWELDKDIYDMAVKRINETLK